MSQANKMHVFESPWKRGNSDSTDRALVRGGQEAPSATRTPLNRTHYIKLLEAAQLLDELFPDGVEQIEVRFVYAEQSYQKQFLTGNWNVPEGESGVPLDQSESNSPSPFPAQLPLTRTRGRETETERSDVWTVGRFSPIRTVARTR